MAAGAIAKKILWLYSRVEVIGFVQSVQDIAYEIGENHDSLTEEQVMFVHMRIYHMQYAFMYVCMHVCMYVSIISLLENICIYTNLNILG